MLMSDCQASSLHQNKMIVTLKNKHTFKWCKKRQEKKCVSQWGPTVDQLTSEPSVAKVM